MSGRLNGRTRERDDRSQQKSRCGGDANERSDRERDRYQILLAEGKKVREQVISGQHKERFETHGTVARSKIRGDVRVERCLQ